MLTKRKGWLLQKVLFLDILCVFIAYLLAAHLYGKIVNDSFFRSFYGNALFVIILSYIGVFTFRDGKAEDVFKRGFIEEFWFLIKIQVKVGLIFLLYLAITQFGIVYSRLFFIVFFFLSTLFIYIARGYFKLIMMVLYRNSSYSRKCLLITTSVLAEEAIEQFHKSGLWDTKIECICIIDKDMSGQVLNQVKVIANLENIVSKVQVGVVDHVFILLPPAIEMPIMLKELILDFEKMGLAVHITLNIFNNIKIENKRIGNFAGYQVLSFSSNLFDSKLMFVKRIYDIMGGLIGLAITGLLTIILSPLIYLENPGPIFFSQTRIGKNGRRFKLYKFRSMVENAEDLKEQLMEKNEMDGLMFKMEDDPRVTKVGKFIRKTSLDEFPQFLNVLKGDMSLVGTRPPTEDEFEQYGPEYRRRVSIRPGITGLWQVSGRSDITNFEKVIKLDLEYIDNWSLGMDIKIMLKTVWIVFFRKGAK